MSQNKKLSQQRDEMLKTIRHFSLTIGPLYADMDFALSQWVKEKGNQFWRRTLIRCILATTEALMWNMKNIAPLMAAVSGVQLSQHDLDLVNEWRVETKDGKAVKKKNFLPFRDNTKAAFALFAKVFRSTYKINFGPNFDALCNTYELRNRLMHPKRPFDLDVSDDAIRESQRGVAWLAKEYDVLMESCSAAVAQMKKT